MYLMYYIKDIYSYCLTVGNNIRHDPVCLVKEV